ncbi:MULTISPECIES: hypothetical protein [Lactiplantibacillus]|uniref:hypothetical protein n=1 Tax=Lactiplantibacillus TaxID=2767842 RepID=UPI0022374E56|nr:hypothetical protein [Lactiplantibacillus plantarum]MCW6146164.1 hypothetical protein [Lactiplantibacillus plantarum]WIR73765.1 hypothetical protein QP382_06045 [Lactiplantibacillus plantarum]
MSVKVKIGLSMTIIALLVGLIGAFVDSLISGLIYIGMMAWVTISLWLIERG